MNDTIDMGHESITTTQQHYGGLLIQPINEEPQPTPEPEPEPDTEEGDEG
jgi:hypothetical protein